jgi:hypothetical protein
MKKQEKNKNIKKTIKNETKIIRKEWKNILFNLLFAFFAVLIPSLLYENIILTTTLLVLVSLIGLFKWKSKLSLAIFLFGAVWGPLSEMFAIHFGAWQYSTTNFYTIPIWLFIVWGDAAVFLFETAKEIKKLGVKE